MNRRPMVLAAIVAFVGALGAQGPALRESVKAAELRLCLSLLGPGASVVARGECARAAVAGLPDGEFRVALMAWILNAETTWSRRPSEAAALLDALAGSAGGSVRWLGALALACLASLAAVLGTLGARELWIGRRGAGSTGIVPMPPRDLQDVESETSDAPHRPRILVVEDDPAYSRGLKRALAAKGYDVSVSDTLAQSSRMIGDGTYDCVLCDVNLADGRGTDLPALIQGPRPPPRIVYMSGDPSSPEVLAKTQGIAPILKAIHADARPRKAKRGRNRKAA